MPEKILNHSSDFSSEISTCDGYLFSMARVMKWDKTVPRSVSRCILPWETEFSGREKSSIDFFGNEGTGSKGGSPLLHGNWFYDRKHYPLTLPEICRIAIGNPDGPKKILCLPELYGYDTGNLPRTRRMHLSGHKKSPAFSGRAGKLIGNVMDNLL